MKVELWHVDKVEKDKLVGVTIIPLADVIKFPIKKTVQSYVRIFDSFHSIDQQDTEGKFIGKVGELRVIIYLEDLGPVQLLVTKAEELFEVRMKTHLRTLGEKGMGLAWVRLILVT